MNKHLLLLIALALAAPALAFDGPTPAVRPPPVLRPPGSQSLPPFPGVVNPPGQPGALPPPPNVSRARDVRYPPATTVPTIYSAARAKPSWAVRIIPPQSAEKAEWKTCEELVVQQLTSPEGLHEATLASARRMTDEQWKCAYERAMEACYLFQRAPTKDSSGLIRSRKANEDFVNEMRRRSEKACATVRVTGDAQEVIDAIIARAVWSNWKAATRENFNRALLDEASPPPSPALLQEAALQARLRKAPSPITTGREAQQVPDVDGIPRRALETCWSKTIQCLNNLPDSRSWSDPLYQCVRWRGTQVCSNAGSRYSHMDKSDTDYQQRWGGTWSMDSTLGKFEEKYKRHCDETYRRGVDSAPFEKALFAKCDSLWQALFR